MDETEEEEKDKAVSSIDKLKTSSKVIRIEELMKKVQRKVRKFIASSHVSLHSFLKNFIYLVKF